MRITDVKVRKTFQEGPLKAIVSVTFDDCLAVHDVKVVEVKSKRFVVMPAIKTAEGTYRDQVHPINCEFRTELTDAVIEAYEVQTSLESSKSEQ
jgi:stage V sporulation protein G